MLTTTLKQTFQPALVVLFITTSCALTSQAQYNEETIERLLRTPKTYTVHKTHEKIHVDGLPDEQAWQQTPWTDPFVDIEGDAGPEPYYDTRVKMLWDDDFLYIYAALEEPHVWATLDKHDQIIYHDNDFEVFIQNTAYGSAYYELEINALGTLLDLFMPTPYRAGGKALISWDLNGLQKAVHIEGSLNDPSDTDRFWAIEMAIPFAGISKFGGKSTPQPDESWRINFSRVQWQHDIVDGKYQRKIDESGKKLPEYNWVWSPQGIIDMHAPERWGYIHFNENPPNTEPTAVNIPAYEQVKRKAWLVYYLQRTHKRLHGSYAETPQNLGELYREWEQLMGPYQLELSAGKDWFVAKVYSEQENSCFAINQAGQLTPTSLDKK